MNRATVETITGIIERLAPPAWAESWDNVGLQVGRPEAPVQRVLVALELIDGVVEEAVQAGAELILVHHPPIFRPLKALRFDTAQGRRIERVIQHGISLYVAHTNLDQAPGMTNDTLARAVGIAAPELLYRVAEERYLKLVVFVPAGHEEAVRSAMAAAGAGHIGNYSHCTFQTPGTGTFLPLEGTDPFLGQQGRLEYAEEFRLETILPEGKAAAVVAAVKQAHPYEEVAYDLIPLANPGRERGHGRIGRLERPTTLADLAARVRSELGLQGLRMVGDPGRQVSTTAVGAGSGSMLIPHAARRGADVLITGDIGYHDAQDAQDAGLAILDIGHFPSEQIAMTAVARHLREQLGAMGHPVEVLEAASARDPFRFLTE